MQSFAMDFRFAAAIYPPPASPLKHEYYTIYVVENPGLSGQNGGLHPEDNKCKRLEFKRFDKTQEYTILIVVG